MPDLTLTVKKNIYIHYNGYNYIVFCLFGMVNVSSLELWDHKAAWSGGSL